jgi:hypothetical protein
MKVTLGPQNVTVLKKNALDPLGISYEFNVLRLCATLLFRFQDRRVTEAKIQRQQ